MVCFRKSILIKEVFGSTEGISKVVEVFAQEENSLFQLNASFNLPAPIIINREDLIKKADKAITKEMAKYYKTTQSNISLFEDYVIGKEKRELVTQRKITVEGL